MMEKQAQQRGYQMRWDNSAWALLQYIDFVREQKELVTGRGVKFTRVKPSPLQLQKPRPHDEAVTSLDRQSSTSGEKPGFGEIKRFELP
jgi:hypothetical protein